jgi:hypothetical protein
LKQEREREKIKLRRDYLETLYCTGGTENLPALNVPRQWPFVLLVKVGWREFKTLQSNDGKEMEKGDSARNYSRRVGECENSWMK